MQLCARGLVSAAMCWMGCECTIVLGHMMYVRVVNL